MRRRRALVPRQKRRKSHALVQSEMRNAARAHYEAEPFLRGGAARVRNWYHRSFRYFQDESLAGLCALDIGSSFGEVALALRARGAEVTCLDLTYRAAAAARNQNGLSAVQADALNLPFLDACFDITLAVGVLHHTPDHVAGLHEMARVTRPDGRALVFLYSRYTPYHGLYCLSRPLRRRTAVSSIQRMPSWLFGMLRRPAEFVIGQPLDLEQVQSLVADQFWTPQATFHTKRAVTRTAEAMGLRLISTRPARLYGRWFVFERESSGVENDRVRTSSASLV